jgi:hypothetical protein
MDIAGRHSSCGAISVMRVVPEALSTSLRAKRSNPSFLLPLCGEVDCFAVLAMTKFVGWVERLGLRSSQSEGDTHHALDDDDGFRKRLNPSYELLNYRAAQPHLRLLKSMMVSLRSTHPAIRHRQPGRLRVKTNFL